MSRSGFQKLNLPRKSFSYKVHFYGTHETGTLKSEGMWIYNPENKAKYIPKKKKKPKDYDKGVDQIENTPEIAAVEVLEEEAGAVEQPVPKDTPKTIKAGKRKAAEMNTPKAPLKKVVLALAGAAKSGNNSEEEKFSHSKPHMLGDFDSMSATEVNKEISHRNKKLKHLKNVSHKSSSLVSSLTTRTRGILIGLLLHK